MNSFEEDTHIFILRMWREPREIIGAAPKWRGMIEHVASGQQNYLEGLNEIVFFIIPYLEQMGITPSLNWRIKTWLRRPWAYLKSDH